MVAVGSDNGVLLVTTGFDFPFALFSGMVALFAGVDAREVGRLAISFARNSAVLSAVAFWFPSMAKAALVSSRGDGVEACPFASVGGAGAALGVP